MKHQSPLCIVLLLLFSISLFAQQTKIDSLNSVLKTAKEDTSSINILCELNVQWMNNNLDTAISYGKQALTISESINWHKGLWMANHQLGSCYYLKGDFNTSISYYEKAVAICDLSQSSNGINNTAQHDRLAWKAKSLGNIGLDYFNIGNYPHALEYHLQAIKLNEKIGLPSIRDKINIANIYNAQSDFKNALVYYSDALSLAEKAHDNKNTIVCLGNIGVVYYKQKKFKEALKYYEQALGLSKEMGNKNQVASWLNNLATVYEEKKEYSKALEYAFQALALAEETKNDDNKAAFLGTIGSLYLEKKDYANAEKYLLHSLELSNSIGALNYVMQMETFLSKLYEEKGKYKEALKHFTHATEIQDSLFTIEKNNEIKSKVMTYEFDKKQAQLKAEKDLEIQQQKNKSLIYQWGAAAIILFSLILFLIIRSRQKIEKQNALLVQRNAMKERFSKDLHDQLGSNITNLANYVASGYSDIRKAIPLEKSFVDKVAKETSVLRQNLVELRGIENPQHNTLEGLLIKIRYYATHQFENSGMTLDLQLPELSKALITDYDANRNIYLIVTEALNNITKHSKATLVKLSFVLENNSEFNLTISDNGAGFDTKNESSGSGLKNFHSRAKSIKNGQLKISSALGEGTTIQLIGSLK